MFSIYIKIMYTDQKCYMLKCFLFVVLIAVFFVYSDIVFAKSPTTDGLDQSIQYYGVLINNLGLLSLLDYILQIDDYDC